MLDAQKQCTRATTPTPTTRVPQVLLSPPQRLYIDYAVRRDYSSELTLASHLHHQPLRLHRRPPRLESPHWQQQLAATLALLRRASGCLGSSRGSSSSTSPTPCVSHCLGSSCGSPFTTSPASRVRVPRLVARLVVEYVAYVVHLALPRFLAWLTVDYFACAVRPGDSARRAARRRVLRLHRASRTALAPRAAHRRLLSLHCASRCLGSSRGSS
jgi:hypothetical protein